MSRVNNNIRDYLYEAPGPKTRRRITIATILSSLAVAILLAVVIKRFYDNGQLSARYWNIYGRPTTWKFLGTGLLGTIKVALTSGLLAFVMGMIMMLGRISKAGIGKVRILSGISAAIIEFTRGVPTLLFIYFFFLVVPQMGFKLPAFWMIAIPVAISASGVVAEVLRSGVNAVPKGQTEAAVSLGMRDSAVFFKIVFPQGLRYVIPALISELVIVLKDTTFAYVVSYSDLMQNAKVLISNYDALLSVYTVAAVIYILINFGLNKLAVFLARRWDISSLTVK